MAPSYNGVELVNKGFILILIFNKMAAVF